MDDVGLYGQKYYRELEFGLKSETRSDHKRILELLKIKPTDKVLEIGCGFGVLLKKIPSKKKMGVETNDVAIKECGKRGLSIIKADAEKGLPFKDSSFDIVIMNEVIEHLKKPEFALRECFRILSLGGKIIITTPVRSVFAHNLSSTHFSEMTVKEMRELVQKYGFKVLTQEVCGISFLYPLLENFLFKPFRFLRYTFGRKRKKTVRLIDSGHVLANRTFLKPLTYYRKHFLWLGQSQMVLGQKGLKEKQKQMKVGVISYKYPLYLRGSYFQEFLNKFVESVEKIYLIATRYPKGNFEKAKNIKIFWVSLLNIQFIGELFFMLTVLLKVVFTKELHKVDLINTIGPRGLLAGWYLRRKYQIPLICTIEMLNEKGSLVNNIYYKFVRFLLTRIPIDKFICWSNYYWENHLKRWGIPESKVVIIPAGIDTRVYNPSVDGSEIKKKYAPNSPLIVFAKPLYSTNIEAAKLLVQAIALLKPKTKIKLLIGGGEGKNEVQELAKNLDISDRINFIPQTPFPEIPKYIAAADLVVLPFTYAPTVSRSLLEAMALGKPVITTPVGELEILFRHKRELFFSKSTPQKIAESTSLLLKNRRLADKIGGKAREVIMEKFSLERFCNETIKTISLLIK